MGPSSTPNSNSAVIPSDQRSTADLRYTTADVDYFAEHWREPVFYEGQLQHRRLVNPTTSEVMEGVCAEAEWLRGFADRPDWDGGGLTFTFAGHGRSDDGALVLSDGEITVEDLYEAFLEAALSNGEQQRLRVAPSSTPATPVASSRIFSRRVLAGLIG